MIEGTDEVLFASVMIQGMFEEDTRMFSDIEVLSQWLDSEIEAWEWTHGITLQTPPATHVIKNMLSNLKTHVENFRLNDIEEKRSAMEGIRGIVNNWKLSGCFSSASVFGQMVCKLGIVDPNAAAAATHYMIKGGRGLKPELLSLGASIVAVFRMGEIGFGIEEASEKSHELMVSHWKDFYNAASSELVQFREKSSVRINDARSMLDRVTMEHNDQFVLAEKELIRLKVLYEEGLATRSPVKYWKARAKLHRRSAWRLKKLFIQSSIFMLCFVSLFAYNFIYPFISGANPDAVILWPVTLLISGIGIAAWPLRIISKFWMSEAHLAADAEERTTMVKTYLAMLKDGSLSESHRELILPSLFRSTKTGIVKDDGGPSLHFETVSRLAKGG